jgi:hypothetical protein
MSHVKCNHEGIWKLFLEIQLSERTSGRQGPDLWPTRSADLAPPGFSSSGLLTFGIHEHVARALANWRIASSCAQTSEVTTSSPLCGRMQFHKNWAMHPHLIAIGAWTAVWVLKFSGLYQQNHPVQCLLKSSTNNVTLLVQGIATRHGENSTKYKDN